MNGLFKIVIGGAMTLVGVIILGQTDKKRPIYEDDDYYDGYDEEEEDDIPSWYQDQQEEERFRREGYGPDSDHNGVCDYCGKSRKYHNCSC